MSETKQARYAMVEKHWNSKTLRTNDGWKTQYEVLGYSNIIRRFATQAEVKAYVTENPGRFYYHQSSIIDTKTGQSLGYFISQTAMHHAMNAKLGAS